MPCERIQLPGGGAAIVCGRGRKQRCACGAPSTKLCDWKVKARKSGTCDKPICDRCARSPAPGKDLCRAHHDEWERRGRPGAVESDQCVTCLRPTPHLLHGVRLCPDCQPKAPAP